MHVSDPWVQLAPACSLKSQCDPCCCADTLTRQLLQGSISVYCWSICPLSRNRRGLEERIQAPALITCRAEWEKPMEPAEEGGNDGCSHAGRWYLWPLTQTQREGGGQTSFQIRWKLVFFYSFSFIVRRSRYVALCTRPRARACWSLSSESSLMHSASSTG